MSVTLSASVKSNLLALQTISSQAAQTQNILSTGKKVNSALDNATSFFTAQSLNSRSTTLTNLLDSVSNGVQTIQAANTGISSITKLVDQLKSTAQQALSTTSAYTSQASIASSSPLVGATSSDLRGGTGVTTAGSATSTNAISTLTSFQAASAQSSANFNTLTDTTAAANTGTATSLSGLSDGSSTLSIGDGNVTATLTYDSTAAVGDNTKFSSLSDLSTKLSNLGVKASVAFDGAASKIQVKATDTSVATLTLGGTGRATLGLGTSAARQDGSTLHIGDGTNSVDLVFDSTGNRTNSFSNITTLQSKLTAGNVNVNATLGGPSSAKLVLTGVGNSDVTVYGTSSSTAVLGFNVAAYTHTAGSTISINDGAHSQTFTYDANATNANATSFSSFDDLKTKLANTNVKAIADTVGSGSTAQLKLTAADNATSLTVGGTGATALGGLTGIAPVAAPSSLTGKTLSFTLQGNTTGVPDATITFGDPATTPGTVKSLDDVNAKLASAGITASLDAQGNLSFATTSQTASKTFSISGTATGAGTGFTTLASTSPVRGGTGANSRDALVTQFNGLLDQINTLAGDSSFNGLNLLKGDTLSLTFNETNTSKLNVTGSDASYSGLGLSQVSASDFNDGTGINKILTTLGTATNSLSSLSSKLGANLAVVQTRQDFTKSLVSTLTTGADNLTNADMNEEATNLLALQTSQSLAQSALSLANQSNQGVLRLLQ